MSKAGGIPDAWDDDWESQADRIASKETSEQPSPQPNLNKQERLQKHAEANKKLWESADSNETFHYLEANNGVPLTTNFKPQVKVLSRKPVVAKRDPVTGMSLLGIDDDDSKPQEVQMTPEEIRAKQKRERDEKQRRYDEARAKIFGESAPSSRGSSPGNGTVTPPRTEGRGSYQGRGRGRGGGHRNNNNNNNSNSNNNNNSGNTYNTSNTSRPFESRRPVNAPAPTRELFDPGFSPKTSDSGRRGGTGGYNSDSSSRAHSGRDEQQQAIRAPRGPDGTGRGGFGFVRRGNKET